jgi:hypothetical protein
MRVHMCVGAFLLVAVLAPGAVATSGDRVGQARQWAVAYLEEPTLVGSTIVQGPVLFVHDNLKMARGEPCTSVSLFDPLRGPVEEIVAFHCMPRPRGIVRKFTMRTQPNRELGFGCILTEYQFAGETEGHGVPMPANAH